MFDIRYPYYRVSAFSIRCESLTSHPIAYRSDAVVSIPMELSWVTVNDLHPCVPMDRCLDDRLAESLVGQRMPKTMEM